MKQINTLNFVSLYVSTTSCFKSKRPDLSSPYVLYSQTVFVW